MRKSARFFNNRGGGSTTPTPLPRGKGVRDPPFWKGPKTFVAEKKGKNGQNPASGRGPQDHKVLGGSRQRGDSHRLPKMGPIFKQIKKIWFGLEGNPKSKCTQKKIIVFCGSSSTRIFGEKASEAFLFKELYRSFSFSRDSAGLGWKSQTEVA